MMNCKRVRRLLGVMLLLVSSGSIIGFVLYALRQNIHLFFTPSQIKRGEAPLGPRIRIGGMVNSGSVQRGGARMVYFTVTDFKESVAVEYQGILPDLFREGQGVVACGILKPNAIFRAEEILAKHDENYMPPEVVKMLQSEHNEHRELGM